MKKQLLGILITTVILFSGCSGKGTVSTVTEAKKNATTNIVAEAKEATTSNIATDAKKNVNNTEATAVNTDFKPIKPGAVPQLSPEQKKQVSSKLTSAVKNIDDALNSIQDPKDINLNSVN